MTQYKQLDVEHLIATLNINDKAKLLAGKDFWHFEDVPNASIPSVRVSDGPNGVRGLKFFNGTPASCFPSATGIGASFDTDLANEIGKALGDECVAKGAHTLLGPTTNMQRSPLGGRGFESFGEDPVLSGLISSAYINGLQSKNVSACLKHFVANDQEFERFSNDSVVSQRALREIYLEPFRLAVKHAKPNSLMTSYNKVNGTHASENEQILKDILRGEWGWEGLLMSDWTGVYTTGKSIKAGLDVEMPGPPTMRGAAINRQIGAGLLSIDDVDARVREVLKFVNKAIASGIPFGAPETSIDTPALRALLRKASASATVLLKNEASILPISKSTKSIAVIGSNAQIAVPSGGGSASLAATYTVSPLEGIKEAAKALGATVNYAVGASAFRYLPLLDRAMGPAKVEVFADSPVKDWYYDFEGEFPKPTWETATPSSQAFMIDGVPWKDLGGNPRTRFLTTFTPDITGPWEFSLSAIGGSTLYLDGKQIIDNYVNFKPSEMFFNMGSEEIRGKVDLVAGKTYNVEVRQSLELKGSMATPFLPAAAIRVGAYPVFTVDAAREAAVEAAKKSDLAIVIVGTNPDWESEGFDRKTIALPGASDALVSAVLAANPNTIIVTQSGTPVAMPWVKEAHTIVQAFFGGNELGNGLADVLFGKFNPSGKLPLTFPVRLEDNPSFNSFGITSDTPGKTFYGEGIFIGYRHYQRSQIAPLFPFGYGLSYTSFAFSGLSLSSVSDKGEFSVSFKVKNTGKVAGSEVAQVYIAAPVEGRITSPPQELKAFKKVDLAPAAEVEVKLSLEKEAFSYWDEVKDSWVAPAGTYRVLVSTSSEKVELEGEAVLAKTFVWRGL
ncbi:glycoside hydrolase family 3 protein [Meredithblackwellia eburnea MCA 4105]